MEFIIVPVVNPDGYAVSILATHSITDGMHLIYYMYKCILLIIIPVLMLLESYLW